MLKNLWRKIMELITGRTGVQHVKAIDDAEIYKAVFGDGDYVLQTGAKLNASMSGTNAIIIQNGTAVMQGRQCKIRQSDGQETLEIDSGTAGYKRWDVVCIEYNEADGIESAQLVVVKGSTSSSWQEPTIPYEEGDIDAGETHQMKLWGVKLDGINFDSLVDYRKIHKKRIDDVNIVRFSWTFGDDVSAGVWDKSLADYPTELARLNEVTGGEAFDIIGIYQWNGIDNTYSTAYSPSYKTAQSTMYSEERPYPWAEIIADDRDNEITDVRAGIYTYATSRPVGITLTLRLLID